jgi:Flp pilus assembly pilin Flp
MPSEPQTMKLLTIRLLKNDEGQDLIEYGLLIGIITLAGVLAVVSIGGKVNTYFTNVNTAMP